MLPSSAVLIAPSDYNDNAFDGIFVASSSSGTVALIPQGSDVTTTLSVATGQLVPIRTRKVLMTGTANVVLMGLGGGRAGNPTNAAGLATFMGMGATRGTASTNQSSSGANRNVVWRVTAFTAEEEDVRGIRLIWANVLMATGETAGTNTVFVTASVEANGTFYPVFWGGVREKEMVSGAVIVSDEVAVTIAGGTQFWVRALARTANGGEVYHTSYTTRADLGEAFSTTNAAAQVDATGTLTNPVQSAMFAPAGILTRGTGHRSVAIIGSSSAFGTGEDFPNIPSPWDRGYLARMVSTNYGYSTIAAGGQTAQAWVAGSTIRMNTLRAMGPTAIINQMGANDIINGRTLVQVQADLAVMYAQFQELGARIYQVMATPVTTSTDAWATVVNQTPTASAAVRLSFNNWVRTIPSPLSGYIDVERVTESSVDSGKWRVDGGVWTTDGVHTTRHGDIAAALGPFTLA